MDESQIYARISRRGFMGCTAAATLSALAGREPILAMGAQAAAARPTADAVVVLWMAGGMAQTETFDPKRYTPFAPGVPMKDVLSTFPSIPTAVDGIRFTQGLEQIASVIDRGTVIRTFTAADLGFILHSRHQYHWHTGYVPPQPMAMPHLGAVISRTLGRHGALYAEPIWINNSNPDPSELADDNDSFMIGLGARLRVRPAVYLVIEAAPRFGYEPGKPHLSFGLERRAGGHSFQINFSNDFGTTMGQIARGGLDYDNWYLGFNISRKFF